MTNEETSVHVAKSKEESDAMMEKAMREDPGSVGIRIVLPIPIDHVRLGLTMMGRGMVEKMLESQIKNICTHYQHAIEAVEGAEHARAIVLERDVTNVTDFNRGVNFATTVIEATIEGLTLHSDVIIKSLLDGLQDEEKTERGDPDE